MTRFRYHGPLSGVTLRTADGGVQEHMLHTGREVELPEDHPHVQTLIAVRRLTPVPPPESAGADVTTGAAPYYEADVLPLRRTARGGRKSSTEDTTE